MDILCRYRRAYQISADDDVIGIIIINNPRLQPEGVCDQAFRRYLKAFKPGGRAQRDGLPASRAGVGTAVSWTEISPQLFPEHPCMG